MWSEGPTTEPLDLEPFVVVQLETGWRYEPDSGTFRLEPDDESQGTEAEFDPTSDLPAEGRIEPMIPDLAGSSAESLSEPEQALARYFHVFPGKEVDLEELVKTLEAWPCVEGAHLPPRIALP
ncbi:MAG: hypothetical protein ACE5GX_13710 [Thermoanaerobaculia bacterium]